MATNDEMLTGRGLKVPDGLPENITALIKEGLKLPEGGNPELLRIREQYEGGQTALAGKYFPCPEGVKRGEWQKLRRLLCGVNLTRPSVRCWTSAVYGGEVNRDIEEGSIYYDDLDEWIHSVDYLQTIQAWCENAVLFGTSAAVPTVADDGEMGCWLPDPVFTKIYADPMDCRKVISIVERRKNRLIYVTRNGGGFILADGSSRFMPTNVGDWLPVAIAYGEDRTHRGEVEGLSLVGDAVDWGLRVTDIGFNVSILQKLQTRSLLVIIGELEKTDDETDGFGPSKALKLRADVSGSDAKFITPEGRIKETIDIMKQFIGLLATATSIPQDVLDATLTQSVASAEAARIRAIPLVQRAKQLIPIWRANEVRLIQAMAGMLEYKQTNNPLKRTDIAKRVRVDIQMRPDILPQSQNEQMSNLIAGVGAHLFDPEDAIRILNPMMPADKVSAMAAELRGKWAAEKGGAAAVADAAVKSGVAAEQAAAA